MENPIYSLIVSILIFGCLIYVIILFRTLILKLTEFEANIAKSIQESSQSISKINKDSSNEYVKKINETKDALRDWKDEMIKNVAQLRTSSDEVIMNLNIEVSRHIEKLDKDTKENLEKLLMVLKERLDNNNSIINEGLLNIDKTLKDTINVQ